MKIHETACLAALAALLAPHALAQAHTSVEGVTVAGTVENDAFDYFDDPDHRTDRYYTQGIRLGVAEGPSKDAGIFNWFAEHGVMLRHGRTLPDGKEDRTIRKFYGLTQHIYTPEDITLTEPDAKDRPYGGWLYYSQGVMTYNDDELNSMELQVGVVGPSARAGEAQNWYHREVIHIAEAQGWNRQLHDELGINLLLERHWSPTSWSKGDWQLDFAPNVFGSIGNVNTSLGGGATVRFGTNLGGDFGPPKLRSSGFASEFFTAEDPGFYVFASTTARLVVRDVFLDGNSFLDSASVHRRWVVPEVNAGAMGRIKFGDYVTLRLGYTYTWRGEEFIGQRGDSEIGGLTFGLTIGDAAAAKRPNTD